MRPTFTVSCFSVFTTLWGLYTFTKTTHSESCVSHLVNLACNMNFSTQIISLTCVLFYTNRHDKTDMMLTAAFVTPRVDDWLSTTKRADNILGSESMSDGFTRCFLMVTQHLVQHARVYHNHKYSKLIRSPLFEQGLFFESLADKVLVLGKHATTHCCLFIVTTQFKGCCISYTTAETRIRRPMTSDDNWHLKVFAIRDCCKLWC